MRRKHINEVVTNSPRSLLRDPLATQGTRLGSILNLNQYKNIVVSFTFLHFTFSIYLEALKEEIVIVSKTGNGLMKRFRNAKKGITNSIKPKNFNEQERNNGK